MSSFEKPILTTGAPSDQAYWEVTDDPRHDIGTRSMTQDGRAFYYACNRGAAINSGLLLSGAPVDVDFDDLAIAELQIGATSASITSGSGSGKTYVSGELVGGYMQVNSGTGAANQGRQYRITKNPAIASATAATIEFEPIREEAFAADSTVTIVPNPYSAVTVSAAVTSLCVGATSADIPAGTSDPQYFWAQTWGLACVQTQVVSDILGHSMILGTTDGNAIGFVDAATDVPQIIGTNLFTTVAGDFGPIFLQISP